MPTRINRRMRADMTAEQFEVFRTTMRKLRKANKLTIQSLSDIVNATPSHISNIELGKKYPSNELARDIAEVFDTTVEAMCGVDEREPDPEIMKRVGKAYLEKRLAKGFMINEVAGFAGIPREVYMEFEGGKCSLGDTVMHALDRLYKVETEVKSIEIIKKVPMDSPISLDTVDKMLGYVTSIDIGKDEQKVLFRELSEARTEMLERQLFG